MLHRHELTEAISRFPEVKYEGNVFRVTGENFDPVAPSGSGGRWAFPAASDGGCSVLYTSLTRDGAIAEVASYLLLNSPRPTRPLLVHTLEVRTLRALKLTESDLADLGVSKAQFIGRNYYGTQEIGAAINFLGFDGLIVPSARWDCENLIIYTENQSFHHKPSKVSFEKIDWQDWARKNGMWSDVV